MLKAIIFDLDNTLVNFWQFKSFFSRSEKNLGKRIIYGSARTTGWTCFLC